MSPDTLVCMARPHRAARIEDALKRRVAGALTRRGWRHKIIPYTGYGSAGFMRVMARVVFSREPEAAASADLEATQEELEQADHDSRGWRAFVAAPVVDTPVTIQWGERSVMTRTDRAGLIDFTITGHGLQPGAHHVTLVGPQADPVEAAVHVFSSRQRFGIISDIDDTILTTNLPRPLVAGWNTFVRSEAERIPVAGMATMYREFIEDHEPVGEGHPVVGEAGEIERIDVERAEVPVIYVSTGAWNTAPHLTRFIRRNGFPQGPLLLTDWGATNTGWFRSGAAHKRAQLRRIARELPHIRWVLIGDTGQRDPKLYREFAQSHPELVRAIALRQLTLKEQVLTSNLLPLGLSDSHRARGLAETPIVEAEDGWELARLLRLALAEDVDPLERHRNLNWFVETPAPSGEDH